MPSPAAFLAASWRVLATLLAMAVALFSYRYLTNGPMRAPNILANAFANPFLALHVAGAATALLVGPFQFIAPFRRGRLRLHRVAGRIYVLGCLVGGASGLPLALGSTAGPIAASGFGTLSLLWLGATALGWRRAIQGRFADHRIWMLRSWAMTFAAVTLRLFLGILPFTDIPFLDGYRAISWGCWLFNLSVLELYLAAQALRAMLRGGLNASPTAAR